MTDARYDRNQRAAQSATAVIAVALIAGYTVGNVMSDGIRTVRGAFRRVVDKMSRRVK